jgi:hypothetical protein
MSYGITVNGDNNRLLFSTNVNGMFFQGKAALHQSYSNTTTDYFTNFFTGETLFNYPGIAFYEFRITLPQNVTSILPFIYNPVAKRAAFLGILKISNTVWQIFVYACTNPNTAGSISPTINIPQIYVFSDFISEATNVGSGINAINSSGKVTFSSNSKPLIFNALYNANVSYSNLTPITNSISYIGNGPVQQNITYYNSILPTSGITKPAIFFTGNQTVRGRISGVTYIYESTARFLPVTSQLAVEWAYLDAGFSDESEQSTSPPFTAMVIDAAQYD